MASDLRKKKYLHAFNTFFDDDKNGSIEKGEIDALVKKVSELRGWTPDNAKYKEVQDIWQKVWSGMLKQVDVNNDGEVSVDEWVTVWDQYAKNPSAAQEWQTLYEEAVFKLIDNSNDNSISSEEFEQVYTFFGLNKNDVTSAFQKASKGKAEITRNDHQQLWKEFFTSDDPNAPGNFVCGAVVF